MRRKPALRDGIESALMSPAKKQVKMREQSPLERINNWNEVPLGYSADEAILESQRCLQCRNKPCIKGCPVLIEIPEFIKAIVENNFQEAIDIIHKSDALPAVTGRVCPQEDQCQLLCIAGKTGDPISIGRLERFSADWDLNNRIFLTNGIDGIGVSPGEKRVAVVGSGPAGLSCAADLARNGYQVTVFEGYHKPGGVLVYGIPEFRLPKLIVKSEIDFLINLGVTFMTNILIGRALTIEDLFNEGYEAIFIGTGAGLPKFMNIPGENLNAIYSANEFLTRVNLMKAYLAEEYDTPVRHGKNVAVIGGGNVAMDAARTAIRLGAEHVYIVYRRTENEMPARIEEMHHALEEGIEFLTLTAPVLYKGDENGFVKNMVCQKMELGEPDASGRRSPKPLKGSEFSMAVDEVIVAIGSTPNPIIARTTHSLNLKKNGEIIIDDKCRTSVKGVFAGGDIVTGSATVVTAMGTGRLAAKSIHEYFQKGNWDS